MGELNQASIEGSIFTQSSDSITNCLSIQPIDIWNRAKPQASPLSGEDYKKVWKKLNGL